MLLETAKADWTEVKDFVKASQMKCPLSPGWNKEVHYEWFMQINRDGEMAGTLTIWDFSYLDAENNENCEVVKKANNKTK